VPVPEIPRSESGTGTKKSVAAALARPVTQSVELTARHPEP
jgi:hypothetical protein